MLRCAFLSMDNLDDYECYDQLLVPPLNNLGWNVDTISWRNETVDWNHYDVVIIRSCWDYQQEPERFLATLNTIEQSNATLTNSLALVKWNIQKTYLKKLEAKQIPIVPTLWKDQFKAEELISYYKRFETDNIIIKPEIGAGADHIFWLKKGEEEPHLQSLKATFKDTAFMVQPFLKPIITEGEYSLFFFDGNYSHTVLKTPKSGDFRVQEEHGGILQLVEADETLLNLGEKTLKALPEKPLYARIDLVQHKGAFVVIEVEIIEPSLYFNMDDESPQRFARSFQQWWNRNGK